MAVWSRQARPRVAVRAGALGAVAVFALALGALALSSRDGGSRERLTGERAVQAALDDPGVRRYLARGGFTRTRVTRVDERLSRVSFFDGARVRLEVAVAPDGRVANEIRYGPRYVRIGGETAQRPLVIALLCAVFALALCTRPLRSLRNLDVLALASFAVPVVLMNERLLEASVYASYPPLAYLCLRCAGVALGERARAHAQARPRAVRLVRRWDERALRRLLAIATAAAAVALVLLAIPGGLVGDVAFASMAGATDLAHGTLPYGHLHQAELVHGDTYPLLGYAAYLPAALATPVRSAFDQLDGALWIATALALVSAAGMYLAGRRQGGHVAGLRLALAWLAFPPVVIAASAGSNDMVAAACIAWAAAAIAVPGRSAALVTAAGWAKLAPLVLLPAWILRGRGGARRRAAGAALAVTLAVAGALVALSGAGGVGDMLDALSFQAERGSLLSLWTLTGAKGAQLAVQAAVVTVLVVGAVRAATDSSFAGDPRRLAALGAALLLGVQLAANYWTYAYLPWAFPLIAVALIGARGGKARPAAVDG